MLALADLSLRSGDDKTHVKWLERAAATHPQALKPRLALARHLLARGDRTGALAAAREAVNAQPDDPAALDLLGATQLALGDTPNALGSYRKLVERQPGQAAPRVKLATAQVVAKDLAAARRTLQDALRIQPDLADAQLMLGGVEIQAARFEEAIRLARRMQQQAPDKPAGFTLEGDAALARRDYTAALAAFERAHRLDPSGVLLVRQLQVFNATGRVAEGEKRLAAWLAAHPQDATTRAALAESLIRRKQYRAAAEHYLLLNQSNPESPVVLNNLAWALFEARDARAAPFARQALTLQPDNPAVLDTVGWILANSDRPAEGLQHLRKASAAAPDRADIQWHLAYALYLTGDHKRAFRELEDLLGTGNSFSDRDAAQKLHAQLSGR
jgi:putative PEP-CTERM system TPR-repeat lipoprotein